MKTGMTTLDSRPVQLTLLELISDATYQCEVASVTLLHPKRKIPSLYGVLTVIEGEFASRTITFEIRLSDQRAAQFWWALGINDRRMPDHLDEIKGRLLLADCTRTGSAMYEEVCGFRPVPAQSRRNDDARD